MARSRETKIELTAYDDLFQTDESREEAKLSTVIEVVRSNMAQKGTITVEKSGEVFSSVAGDKGLYQPIFSVSALEGAVYEITAAEDMLNFGKLYDIISDEEKKSLITYLIKEIQIYPNGESEMPLKSIEFNFPIYRDGQEVRRLLWEKGNTVETVVALERRTAD